MYCYRYNTSIPIRPHLLVVKRRYESHSPLDRSLDRGGFGFQPEINVDDSGGWVGGEEGTYYTLVLILGQGASAGEEGGVLEREIIFFPFILTYKPCIPPPSSCRNHS